MLPLIFALVFLSDALPHYFVHSHLFLPSIKGHFDTIHYEHLCPEKQGYTKGVLWCCTRWRAIKFVISLFQSFPPPASELQRTECLKSLREIAIPLAERPARGDLTGEVCHWADGYHLNVKLYEKLLLSVFDVLDEGKLTEVSWNSLECHSL